jgi:hypothetical protein
LRQRKGSIIYNNFQPLHIPFVTSISGIYILQAIVCVTIIYLFFIEMKKTVDWEQMALIDELNQGKELAKQLMNHVHSSSSNEPSPRQVSWSRAKPE